MTPNGVMFLFFSFYASQREPLDLGTARGLPHPTFMFAMDL